MVALAGTSSFVLVTIIYFITTAPSFQSLFVNSDQLTIISVADDIIYNPRFNPFHWNFSRAPYFFPDLAVTVGLRSLIHSDAAVAMVMLILQAAFVAAAATVFVILLAPTREDRVNAVALYGSAMTLAFIGTRHSWYAGAVAWPFISYSHAGALDLTLVGFYGISRHLYVPRRRPTFLLLAAIFTTLAYCSDKISIVFFLPSAFFYFLSRSRREGYSEILVFITIQIVAIGIMLLMDHTLNFQIMENNTLLGLPAHLTYVAHFFETQRFLFRVYMTLVIISTILIFTRSALLIAFGPQDRGSSGAVLSFLLSSSSLVNIALLFWLWSTDEEAYTRYSVMIQFAGPICLVSLLQLRPFRRGVVARAGLPVFCTVLLVAAVTWQGQRDPFDIIAVQKQRGAELQTCVAQNGLHSGYAAYWLARQLSSSTNWKIQVDQFAPAEPVPFFWGSNITWFFDRLRGGGENHHDFVILDDLPEKKVFADYGRPDEVTTCGGHTFAIYRTADRLENKVAFHLAQTLSGNSVQGHLPQRIMAKLHDQTLAFGIDDLTSLVGHRESGSITLSPDDGPGYGLFGPWLALAAGSYHATIAFTCSGDVTDSHFEIAAGDLHQRVVGWLFPDHQGVCDGQVHRARMALDTEKPLSMVELRAYYSGEGDLSISDVQMGRAAGGS